MDQGEDTYHHVAGKTDEQAEGQEKHGDDHTDAEKKEYWEYKRDHPVDMVRKEHVDGPAGISLLREGDEEIPIHLETLLMGYLSKDAWQLC